MEGRADGILISHMRVIVNLMRFAGARRSVEDYLQWLVKRCVWADKRNVQKGLMVDERR